MARWDQGGSIRMPACWTKPYERIGWRRSPVDLLGLDDWIVC